MGSPEYHPSPPAIGVQAQAWLELHDAYWSLVGSALSETNETARSTMQQAADRALLQMEFYEDDPQTALELQDILAYQPPLSTAPEHRQIEARRQSLQELLTDTSAHNQVINPTTIQAKLDTLPAPEFEPGHPENIVGVARFALTHGFGRTPQSALPTSEALSDSRGSTNQGNNNTGESSESLRETLAIKVYRGDFVIEFPDGTQLPLRRQMDLNKYSAQEEDDIAAFRLAALQYISGLTEPALTSAVWKACRPDSDYIRSLWDTQVGGFLEQIKFQDIPLVSVDKSVPKRRFWGPGPYKLAFEYSDEASGLEVPEYFALPDGTLLSPREAKIMHALLKVSADEPLTREIFASNAVLTPEELQTLKNPEIAFSSTVNQLLAKLRRTGFDGTYVIHKTNHPTNKTPGGRPEVMYWVEVREPSDEELHLNRAIYNVAQLVSTNAEHFKAVTGKGIEQKQLQDLLHRYTNKLRTEVIDSSTAIEDLRELTNSMVFEHLMDNLDTTDPAFELLELLGSLVDDDPAAEARLKTLLARLNPVNNPDSIFDDPADKLLPYDTSIDRSNLHNHERLEQMAIDMNSVEIDGIIEACLRKVDQLGWLQPGIKPTGYSITQAFGIRLPASKEADSRRIVEHVIFKVVSDHPDFIAMTDAYGRNNRAVHAKLGDIVREKLATHKERLIA